MTQFVIKNKKNLSCEMLIIFTFSVPYFVLKFSIITKTWTHVISIVCVLTLGWYYVLSLMYYVCVPFSKKKKKKNDKNVPAKSYLRV